MISLVMATYNGGKYLREQLDSIYNQTLLPDEIIVVDDCSKDDTIDILKEYSKKYNNLKYYQNETNQGVNKNFEKAISLANGDYISICDQDDVWMPYKIETLYNKIKEIEKDKPACVSSRSIDVDKDLNILYKKKHRKEDSTYEEVLYSNASQGCTMIFNKKLKEEIIPIPEQFIYDAYIGILSVFIGNRYVINKPLMFYRHHGNNVVANQIHKYHHGLSEAILLYSIIKKKERVLLLKHIEERIIDEDKKKLFDELLHFLSCKNNTQMIYNVLKCKYIPRFHKLNFILYTYLATFIEKRKISS